MGNGRILCYVVSSLQTYAARCRRIQETYGRDSRGVQIDIDQEDALANFYTIESVPTFILMRKGEQLWRQSGELDLERLKKAVKDFKS